MRVTLAMLFYFGLVFGVGFLLGPIRVLWLEPHWTDHCEGLRSALYVAGHPSRGALGTTRLEHPARSKNARLGVGSLVKWRISRSASGCGASPQENNVQLLTGQRLKQVFADSGLQQAGRVEGPDVALFPGGTPEPTAVGLQGVSPL